MVNLQAAPRDPLDAGQDQIIFDVDRAEPSMWTLEGGNQIGAPLKLDHDEVETLALTLLQGWQREVGFESAPTPLQSAVKQRDDDADRHTVILAAEGNHLFHIIRDALGEPMKSAFDRLITDHLQKEAWNRRALVFMSDVFVPWRMLYADPLDLDRRIHDDDDPHDVRAHGFLGLAGVVDQMMFMTNPPSTVHGTLVPIGVHTGFAGLPGGSQDVLKALGTREDLRPSVETDEDAFVKAILTDQSALIYTFCHGRVHPGLAARPVQELVLDKKPLTGGYLERRLSERPTLNTAPVVFINACQGGVMDVDHTTTVINALRKSGASGTIGPALDMPTCFGGVFGAALIRLLAQGETASGALLETTRSFMSEERNPLGLAYISVNGRGASLPHTTQRTGGG